MAYRRKKRVMRRRKKVGRRAKAKLARVGYRW